MTDWPAFPQHTGEKTMKSFTTKPHVKKEKNLYRIQINTRP